MRGGLCTLLQSLLCFEFPIRRKVGEMDVGRNGEMGRGKGKALHSCDKKRRKIRRKGLGWLDRKGGDDKARAVLSSSPLFEREK